MTDEQKLAEKIHAVTCSLNHIDICGWDYENWDDYNLNRTRGRYVAKAKRILKIVPFDVAMSILNEIGG